MVHLDSGCRVCSQLKLKESVSCFLYCSLADFTIFILKTNTIFLSLIISPMSLEPCPLSWKHLPISLKLCPMVLKSCPKSLKPGSLLLMINPMVRKFSPLSGKHLPMVMKPCPLYRRVCSLKYVKCMLNKHLIT